MRHDTPTQSPGKVEFTWPEFPLGIGTGRLCSLNGGLSISKATDLLRQAHDLGVRFFDTAPSYGQGQAEQAIGRLDSSKRNDAIVCTKVGYSLGSKGHLINVAKPFVQPILPWVGALRTYIASARDRAGETGGSMTLTIEPAAIRTAIEGSLKRLNRDYIDLYMMHDPSADSVEDEANQQEFEALVKSGKIRCWGISTSDGDVARRAAAVPGCSVIEMPGYPAWVDANPKAYEACSVHGVKIIANGVLTPLTRNAHTNGNAGPAMSAADCIKYAFHLPETKMVLCGARQAANLNSNVAIMRQLLTA